MILLRRKTHDVAEVAVQGDQGSLFRRTRFQNSGISGSSETLVPNPDRIMSDRLEELEFLPAEILVELELHGVRFAGTGMILSRAASAP